MGAMTPVMFGNTLLDVVVAARKYHQRMVTKQRTVVLVLSFFAQKSVVTLRLLIVLIRDNPWLGNFYLPNSGGIQT